MTPTSGNRSCSFLFETALIRGQLDGVLAGLQGANISIIWPVSNFGRITKAHRR